MTITGISNDFIDEYLAQANGDFLKVYIYLKRHEDKSVSAEDIADALNMTEKDVGRAIKFWTERGQLKEKAPEKDVNLAELNRDDEFKALLLGLQNYLGKTFTNSDAETVAYMYENLKMPAELIEHLFEICKQKGKTSLRYIEKIALDWYEKGIDTVEKANEESQIFSAEISAVMKNFGISGRDLTPKEKEYVDRWYKEWHMTRAQVEDACSRTTISTGRISFAYADAILKSLHDGTTEADLEAAKERNINNKTSAKHNFTQRKNNLDSDVLDKFNDLIK